MASEINVSDELNHFIKDTVSDYYAMQVVLFFADHPYARFNKLAIIQALKHNGGERLIQQALRDLVNIGIINTWMDGEVTLFSLIEHMRNLAFELAQLDVLQQQRLLQSNFTKKRVHLFRYPTAPVLRETFNIASTSTQGATALNSERHQPEKYAPLVGVK
ncbi:hypothetical protein ACFLVH_01830 [Chloroflexota bacterium]